MQCCRKKLLLRRLACCITVSEAERPASEAIGVVSGCPLLDPITQQWMLLYSVGSESYYGVYGLNVKSLLYKLRDLQTLVKGIATHVLDLYYCVVMSCT